MFKVNNKKTRTALWRRSDVFIVNCEQVNVSWVMFHLGPN